MKEREREINPRRMIFQKRPPGAHLYITLSAAVVFSEGQLEMWKSGVGGLAVASNVRQKRNVRFQNLTFQKRYIPPEKTLANPSFSS